MVSNHAWPWLILAVWWYCFDDDDDYTGKYHPHGDTSVYDALVRMAQDFVMGVPLVAGHGNFGSVDNDPPAAMRYTECKLSQLAKEALLADINLVSMVAQHHPV